MDNCENATCVHQSVIICLLLRSLKYVVSATQVKGTGIYSNTKTLEKYHIQQPPSKIPLVFRTVKQCSTNMHLYILTNRKIIALAFSQLSHK